ncbi:MAG TPA: serine/threonine protein kinase [Polyangiaceae bacterium]|nr:serine/threonine protein kinase [Polyangiaceae bacterium]
MNCPACDHVNVDGARYCAKCGALMPVAHVDGNDPMIGQVVGGRYRITGLLGEGGMGRVYVGEQQMGTAVRKVAVKTLLTEFSKDPQVVARFMRECGTVVELEHPNTIKFYDFGQTDQGDLYIAMEYVDGEPLNDPIERSGAMDFERVDNIMRQICGSLHEAHEKGIVHRDLKPENVILTKRAGEEDFVKVLDFGIAKRHDAVDTEKEQKLTQAGMVLGTPPYMSPEQFTGKELDRRSDIYALGVMAYELLTGQLPFKANTPWEWATQHMTQQPSPFEQTGAMAAQIPPHMKAACMKALSKNAEDRQATAREFYEDLHGEKGARLTAPGVASSTSMAEGGPNATEAFTAAVAGSGGASSGRAGKTEIGEPFVPPPGAMGGVGPTAPGGGPPPEAMGGSPHQNVPTAGGQAVPATPARASRGGGGGNKGMMIAAAGVAALLVVGIVFAVSGGGDDEEDIPPLLSSGEPTATEVDSEGGDTDETSGNDESTGGAGEAVSGDAACDEAIAAAGDKKCNEAVDALKTCNGDKLVEAQKAYETSCGGTPATQPPTPTPGPKPPTTTTPPVQPPPKPGPKPPSINFGKGKKKGKKKGPRLFGK